MIHITSIQGGLSPEMQDRLRCTWGTSNIITRGQPHVLDTLSGFVATDETTGRLAGVALYRMASNVCELVVHESIFHRRGIGSRLLEEVFKACDQSQIRRVWLVTSNDNVTAMRYYQKRGFNLCSFHSDIFQKVRETRPDFPKYGCDGIPIRHELEFEMLLDGFGNWERHMLR